MAMLGNAPEISEALEWMFQSRQVGDECLVKNLAHEQYTPVYRFVQILLDSPGSSHGMHLAEQVLYEAVEDAQSYLGEVSLRAWLFNKAIKVTHQEEALSTARQADFPPNASPVESTRKTVEILNRFYNLPLETRIAILLKILFAFTPGEIACVLQSPESRVEVLLSEAGEILSTADGPGNDLQVSEAEILAVMEGHWPAGIIDEEKEDQIARRILRRLEDKARRRHRWVYLGEAFLVLLAILAIAGLDSLVDTLTPEPTRELVHETMIVNQLVYISPTPVLIAIATPFPKNAILYQAEEGETLEEIAKKTSFDGLILAALNNIPADRPLAAGQEVMIGIKDSWDNNSLQSLTLIKSRSQLAMQASLGMSSSFEEIRQRIASGNDLWGSLWADALVIQYAPPGYVGEIEVRRQQVWVDQPYLTYVLDGVNGGQVEFVYAALGGLENLLNTQTEELLSNLGPQDLNYHPDLPEMLLGGEFKADSRGWFEPVEMDMVAGRSALVLDWYQSRLRGDFSGEQERIFIGRFWVDTQLGIILRAQKYSQYPSQHLFKEVIVTQIQIDVTIPRRLYDTSQLSQTYFSRDYSGDYAPVPLEFDQQAEIRAHESAVVQYQPPPAGYALNTSSLDIQWTTLARFDPVEKTTVDLFADGYYLGNLDFAEPEQLVCTRSADGNLVAFSSWSNEIEQGLTPLGWIDLNRLPEVNFFNSDLVPHDFTFSPGNQELAVYACPRFEDGSCGIYIIELESGEYRLLRSVEQGAGLMWSPDGEAIAIQGGFLKGGKWRVLVFDAESGIVNYDGPFDWEGIWVAPDSPIHGWGVQYPPQRGGFELCSKPPQAD